MSIANPAFSQPKSEKNSTFEQDSIPEWTKKFTVLRFGVLGQTTTKDGEIKAIGGVNTRRGKGLPVPRYEYEYKDKDGNPRNGKCDVTAHTLAEFFAAIQQDDDGKKKNVREVCADLRRKEDTKRAQEKAQEYKTAHLNAWSICNDTGNNDGERNGLLVLDFDHVENQQLLKNALSHELGILAAWKSASVGVAALIYAPDLDGGRYAAERIAEHMRAQGILFDKFDPACKSHSLLRLESYDPAPFIAPELCEIPAEPCKIPTGEKEEEINEKELNVAFYAHPISQIVDAFGAGSQVKSRATAAALALIGVSADVRSRLYTDTVEHAARAITVLVEEAGSGKTDCLDLLRAAGRRRGAFTAPGVSVAACVEIARRCGSKKVPVYDDEDAGSGKKKKQKDKWIPLKAGERPTPFLMAIDEAGSFLSDSRKNEKNGELDLFLRKAFCDTFTPWVTRGALEGRELEEFGDFPANITTMLCATPAQWLNYAATIDESNGLIRRWLVFMPRRTGAPETLEEILSSRIKPDKERILEFSDSIATRIPYHAVFEIGADAVAAGNEILKELQEAGVTAESCPTLIFNYATLCAVARCALTGASDYHVTPEDVRACACILRAGKCDSRKEMQEKIELKQCAKYKSENEVWVEITEKLQNPIRLDKLNEWIRRRPPVYAETYNKMRSRGETVEERSAEKKRGRIVRRATGEERQKAEEERQKAKASAFDRSTPQEYPDCTEQERRSRAQKYIEKFLQDHPLTEGTRNTALNELVFNMQKAGIWDEVAQQLYYDVAAGCGLPDREVKTLMRTRAA